MTYVSLIPKLQDKSMRRAVLYPRGFNHDRQAGRPDRLLANRGHKANAYRLFP
jgi:hypothetical protein